MKCSSCGADVEVANVFPGGSVTCACGAKVVVGAPAPPMRAQAAPPKKVDPVAQASGACPRCKGPLNKRTVEETVADVCATGDGLFIAHDHLATLRAKGASSPAATSIDRGRPVEEEETRYLPCPKCGARMMRKAAGGGIVVDVCSEHGTWFDAGELKAALATKPPPETGKKDQARATIDVALALNQARDDQNARRAIDAAEDVLDTFNFYVFGLDSRRRDPRTW